MPVNGKLKLGFVILAHERPDHIVELVDTLTQSGGVVSIHYDARCSDGDVEWLKSHYHDRKDVVFARRERCGWGDFSLVRATLNGLEELKQSGAGLDYVYLLSGSDLPIRPLQSLENYLLAQLPSQAEFIESVPLWRESWVKGGLEYERFSLVHPFNERRHPRLFKMNYRLRRYFGRKASIPSELTISLGSQWWCLTWATCLSILDYIEKNPAIYKFFTGTWIPDESFFQTLIRNLVPEERIRGHSLTFYQFTDYGKPYVFFDEHENFLVRQNFFFARKIAFSAKILRGNLHQIGRSQSPDRSIAGPVGASTGELDAYRVPRRTPVRSRRSIGVFYRKKFSDIEFTGKLLLMQLTAVDVLTHGGVGSKPHREADWLAHGNLFSSEGILFRDADAPFGGYRKNDLAARNSAPAQFIANIMGAGPAVTAFSTGSVEGIALAMKIRKARNVFIAISGGASLAVLTTAELLNRRVASHAADLPCKSLILQYANEIEKSLAALKFLSESSVELPNVRLEDAANGLIAHAAAIDGAKGQTFAKALAYLLKRNQAAEAHLAGTPLGIHVSATLSETGQLAGLPLTGTPLAM